MRARGVLVAITIAAWLPALAGSFQYDDLANVLGDPATSDAGALLERLATGFRPLLRLSYFVDHTIWGRRAAGFLATQLALHVATVLGVLAFARARLAGEKAAWLAALLFALQPAHGEVIAYVSGRSTGLMAALAIWALVAWERRRVALALTLFALACLAKEVALALPLLVLFLDRRRVSLAWAGVAAALAVALLLSPRYRDLAAYSFALRDPLASLATNLAALPLLLSLWIRPWALTVDHAFDASAWTAPQLALGIALALALMAGALQRRDPLLALACAWVLVSLAPTQSFVAKLDVVTEKPLYFAWIGPAIWVGARLAPYAAARVAMPAALALLCAWRAVTWSDPVRLWDEATRAAPGNARAWTNLGAAKLARQDHAGAVAAFERASALAPDDASVAESLRLARMLAR